MENAGTGLTAVYIQQRAALLRFLCARCNDRQEAEDALQELWLKLDGPTYGPIANPAAYLFRMANNLVLDRRRSRTRAMRRDMQWLVPAGASATGQPAEQQPDPATPADEAMASEQERTVLHHAIAQLPPGARQALMLFRFEGHSQPEVAAIMGISRSGVEKHLVVAMKHLRAALANCGVFDAVTSSQNRQERHATAPKEQGQ